MKKNKIIRIVTVPESFGLFKGQMNYMKDSFDFMGISSNGDSIKLIEEDEGIKIYPINLTRKITPIKDLVALYKLTLFLKREKPHIVHSHTPKAGTIGMIAAYLAGVKHRIHTVAGMPLMETSGMKRFLLDCVEKITYACSTKIYPNSYNLKDFILRNKYTTNSKLDVIGEGSTNGINTSFFSKDNVPNEKKIELKKIFSINEDTFTFIYVGRIVRDKGIIELVKAFKIFNLRYSNSRLLILGKFERELDPLPGEIEEEIINNESIIYCGFQTDVRAYFSISNVFLFPSYREGFPNVVMQAGAMEVPSIVTDINGSNEIIKDTINGYIVAVKNDKALLEKMEFMYNNRDILLKMKKCSREMILSRYEQKKIWFELLNMYKSLE